MSGHRSRRPDHQTVVASLALLIVLITGTAYAAATIDSGDVINNSLKSADLKNNAGVKGADIPANNLRGADFGRGAQARIRGADVGNDDLGGAQVNEASVIASRVIARLGGLVNQPIALAAGPIPFLNNTYTQPAGSLNEFIAGGQITFSAACTQPRNASIYLLGDSPVVALENIRGFAQLSDTGAGAVTKRFQVFPSGGGPKTMSAPREPADTPHQFFLYGDLNCNSGSGATMDSLLIDVVAHR